MADTTKRPVRYPHSLITTVDAIQNEAIRAHAAAVNRSISEVVRLAIAAGLPVLRQRAEQDGTLAA
jgi:hypothetical protein